MRLHTIVAGLAVCIALLSQETFADACYPSARLTASNPDQAYILPANDGTVIDSRTGLMWKRCSEGQTWNSSTSTCGGSATKYTWEQALQQSTAVSSASHTDWRVPNIKELRSLIEDCRELPAVNRTLFPGLQATAGSNVFWSSTPALDYRSNQNLSWRVDFDYGSALGVNRGFVYYVRLVRGGDYYDNLAAAGSAEVTTSLLSVSAIGSGTVTTNSGGVSCAANASALSGTCQAPFTRGTTVRLTAAPAGGNPFIGWSGVCSGTALTCDVTMPAAQSAVALFQSVAAQAQTIGTISFTPSSLGVGGTTTASATATSGLAVSFTSSTPSICSVSGSTVTGVAAGVCTVTANQPGDGTYTAAPAVTQAIAVKAAQAIGTIGFTPTTLAVGGTTTASASGGASGNPVIFSSLSPLICGVSGTNGSIISGLSAGICTIAANQAGGLAGGIDYAAAPTVAQNLTVDKGAQTIGVISFSPSSLAIAGTTTASATVTSGLAVSFSNSVTPTICSVSGSTVTGLVGGTCTITASQTGNANYLAAPSVTQDIIVKTAQTIGTITFSPVTLVAGGTTTASATASSGLAVSFSSTTTNICTVSGSIVTGVAIGICIIAADQAGNGTYAAATQKTQTIAVSQGGQVIGTISFSPTPLTVGGTTTASAAASSGLAVTFLSATPAVCTVGGANGSIVTGAAVGTGTAAGRCTILAIQAGNANYSAAEPMPTNIMVGPGSQTIGTINFLPNTLTVGGTSTASATASSGLVPVIFTSLTTSVCTVGGTNGSVVTGVAVGSGTCTIAANQAGNENYVAAPQVSQDLTVKPSQTIGTISFSPGTLAVGGTTTASATASSGLVPVVFSSLTISKCTVSGSNGSVIRGVAGGTCTIAANQAGSANFAAAPQVTQNIAVDQSSQTIGSITLSTGLTVGGVSTAIATASSGLAVSFASNTPLICTTAGSNGSTVTGVLTGSCSLTATQLGNTSYLAATPVTSSFSVRTSQTIGTISFTPSTLSVGGGTTTASATATSGLTVTFDSASPAQCTVSGTTITGVAVGTCYITANQDGDGTYVAAPPKAAVITVTASSVSFTPTSLSFSEQHVGSTSTAKSLVLTNTGASPVAITSIVPTGDFAATGCADPSLAAGASCSLSVTFAPTAAGNQIVGSITLTSNAANSPYSAAMSGKGVAANVPICTLTAAPARVTLGRSSTLTASCSPAATSFSWTGGTCAGTTAATCAVSPGATTTYGVTGTNSNGSGSASAIVTVKAVDLTPILMLLLD